MSLLRPRPNRRLDRCESSLPSPFSASLSSSLLSLVRLSRSRLFLLPSPSIFLFLSISSQYLSAHLRAGFSRQTMHRATPSKTSTSLVAATRKRKKERGAERTELLSTPVRKFISETKSSQRTDSGTSTVALKFSGCLVRSRRATLVLIYPPDMLNLSNNIKSY